MTWNSSSRCASCATSRSAPTCCTGRGLIHGPVHLGLGQEAVAVGAASVLRPGRLLAGHLPRATRTRWPAAPRPTRSWPSCSAGRAGSAAARAAPCTSPACEHGYYGSYAIVGAHLPIACGLAWAAKIQRTGQVTVCFFGDGDDQHRRVPRGGQPGRGVAAAGRVRLREQLVHGVHPDRGGDPGRAARRRPGRRLRAGPDRGRRQRRGRRPAGGRRRGRARPGTGRARAWSRRRPTGSRATRPRTVPPTGPPRRWRGGASGTRCCAPGPRWPPRAAAGAAGRDRRADQGRPGRAGRSRCWPGRRPTRPAPGPTCGATGAGNGGTDLPAGRRRRAGPGDGPRRPGGAAR